MYHGLLALLTRSLRLDARQVRNHFFRLAFVGFIYLSLLMAMITSGSFGAPGLRFFASMAWLNLFFISCAGIGFFSSAITEEKEEDTIGLLQMAGLNPIGILFGKSTSRLIQAAMLLIVQFPFSLLAVTLGGVTPHQIFAAYAALLSYMILLANVALFWSTVCVRGGTAAGMTTLLFALYFATPGLVGLIQADLATTSWASSTTAGSYLNHSLDWIRESSIWDRLSKSTETGFNDPIISRQVITNIAGGVISFLASWMMFTLFADTLTSQGATRGVVMKSSSRVAFLSPGRAWSMPLIWKDFQFIGGGYLFGVIKLIAYVGLFPLIFFVSSWNNLTSSGIVWDDAIPMYVGCMIWVVVIEGSILASRIFHDEVRLQTMSSLLMLPRNVAYIGYSKAIGCLIGLIPSIACLLMGTALLPGMEINDLIQGATEPAFWGIVLAFLIFLHLVALLSLFVKWGALPLAIFVMGPLLTCCPVGQLLFVVLGANGGIRDSYGALAATVTVWILMGLVCFVFQMMIAARLQEIGSK